MTYQVTYTVIKKEDNIILDRLQKVIITTADNEEEAVNKAKNHIPEGYEYEAMSNAENKVIDII